MGRKIPGKKHNKLKSVDPFNTKSNSKVSQRLANIRMYIRKLHINPISGYTDQYSFRKDDLRNRAPKKLSQEAPGALKRLFDIEQEASPKKKRKRNDRITGKALFSISEEPLLTQYS